MLMWIILFLFLEQLMIFYRYLIYSNKNKSIICYDLNDQKTIKELKHNHNEYITNISHYLDEINKKFIYVSLP